MSEPCPNTQMLPTCIPATLKGAEMQYEFVMLDTLSLSLERVRRARERDRREHEAELAHRSLPASRPIYRPRGVAL